MALQWDESLVLGLDEIDEQHRSMFDHFEKLSAAIQEGKSKGIIEQLTRFLFDYTHVHFSTEDRIMVEYEYPYIELQRREHAQFTRDAGELSMKLEQQGASRELAIETTGKMFRWIIQHIKKHDREMVEFVKERIAQQ